ncbi:hypothetical protein NQ314_006220 [Rhamnusium bicolor]|uniref:Uncharacterized protein n=1 Tax=Rhamnusium bicolor TaxID=1586634 RepID=A0AAV8Z7P1_9CUCU|nr:hypothetical protein NQ314_006220 [Rhamnusium bicolor]
MNLKDVVYALDEAWQQVNPELIKKSWTKLLPSSMEDNPPSLLNDDDEDDIPLSLLLKKMCENTIPIDLRDEMDDVITLTKKIEENISNGEIEEWVLGNDEIFDLTLTDDDIIQEVEQQTTVDNENEDSSSDDEVYISSVKHEEAISAFNTCLRWSLENNIPSHKILLLRELRNHAINANMNLRLEYQIFLSTSHKNDLPTYYFSYTYTHHVQLCSIKSFIIFIPCVLKCIVKIK